MRGKTSLAAWLVCMLAIAGACNSEPDVQKQVDKALDEAKLAHVDVDWDPEARVAHLKGSVDSPVDKARAGEVAARSVGTSGMVANEISVAGTDIRAQASLDGDIRERLNALVQGDKAWTPYRNRDINFEVTNGAVTITGEVASAKEKEHVGHIVRAVPGVKDVTNALKVVTPR